MSIVVKSINNPPYKGKLVDLMLSDDEIQEVEKVINDFDDYVLTPRQLCDLEMILNGGFSPLTGFLNEEDYNGVVNDMRLSDGTFWPMPINLDVSEEQAGKWEVGKEILLRDSDKFPIAILTVETIYKPDKAAEAEHVFGSPDDVCHPAIAYLLNDAGAVYVGGSVKGIQLPIHYDFTDMRYTPKELRAFLKRKNISKLVGFQTRNPMHRSHRELTLLAARKVKANVLIHPVVGMTKPGDVDHYTRVRCYQEMISHYPRDMALCSLLPLAMRMAGPREACWHAIIRKNYGCTHFIVGRDHAGPGKNKDGESFYDPYAAQELLNAHKEEIGIEALTFKMVCYVEDLGEYRTIDNIPEGSRVLNISGTELRRRLYKGISIPSWFSFPSVVKILRETYPPRNQQGFTLFFTGLANSGKSTIANAVRVALLELGGRTVSLLVGGHVRKHLSTELGFSKEHRDLNVRRIGYVASEITKARGVAICSAIAPYKETRGYVRELINKTGGGFVEIHVNTPLEVCEQRDNKGLYAKARSGELQDFTGISDPYEAPESPEVTVDTSVVSVSQAVHEIILFLEQEGYLSKQSI
eukprot:TRINITY_DN14295_c0_g1_i1.p1 TRINITY_DN14295_c0_g1~~TRINITY_DN14295_c0_g1_i1.p1  ORF type:complete len:582 (-),score=248.53 TRINITY_DN14295_c0_g1_i1:127-1872(-)